MNFIDAIKILIRSRQGNGWVQTRDEFRAEALIVTAVSKLGYRIKVWRASLGLFDYTLDTSKLSVPDARNPTLSPVGACQQLFTYNEGGPLVVIFEDVAEYLKNPATARWFKDLAIKAKAAQKASHVQVVVVDTAPVPLEGFVGVDLDLPNREELTGIVENTLSSVGIDKAKVNIEDVVDVITGLEAVQAQRAINQCLADKKGIDLRAIMTAKKDLIKGAAAITWVDPPEGGLKVVGGLDVAKRYVQRAEKPFRSSRQTTVRRPKGFIASGVPGTGKTYLSHCVGAAWGLPVLNFDISTVMGGIVGETEKNMDRALEIAKACAPCVLCLDELEKGLAGSGGDGRTDGGVMNRIIDKLLKFLNSTTEQVFVIVTMNDPIKLQNNPELFRRGRFDKIFWVDVPNRTDRLAVLQIHAASKNVTNVDLGAIADATKNFTGAELESILDEATWAAQDEERAVTTKDCLEAAKGIVPIVEMWGDRGTLGEAREWAKRSAVWANNPEETATESDSATATTFAAKIDMGEDEDAPGSGNSAN